MNAEQWTQAQALFHAAIEQPAEGREAYLSANCSDPTIATEVRQLIEADADSQAFLDRMAVEVNTLLESGAPQWSGDARYADLQWLGVGGMAVVHRARDSLLERNVALKMLSPVFGVQPGAKARFLSEAKAVAALDHPNICTVYDLGELPGGELYIAMALYEGETLASALARGPLPFERSVGLTRQIARGLQYAHARGIVHRDIKPSNIFLTDEGIAKILDFGIAKLADADHTRQGEIVGTLRYASPEQLAGSPVDHRTDIWSLGALFYEMLEGAPAFAAASPAQLIRDVEAGPRAPLRQAREAHRGRADQLLDAMLSPDRETRFASVAELLAALDDSQAETPDVVARPQSVADTMLLATAAIGDAPRPELRQGTAVVVDLCDVASLQTTLDAEQMHNLLRRYASALEEVAERYGGRVHQQLGKSVSMLFGVPVAYGNDAERALRAAGDARTSMIALGREFRCSLEVCAGVATGEFMADRGDSLAELSPGFVSTASSLASTAAPGEIWMTAEIHAALRDRVEVVARSDTSGQPAPGAYRLERLVGETGVNTESPIPFVGRRAELRQLEGVLDECRESGVGQLVLIRGEAGIGKTRLGDELAMLAVSRGFACHTTRAYDFGVPQGQDTIAVLSHSLLRLDLGAPEVDKALVAHAAADNGVLEIDSLVFAHELLGLPAPADQWALYDAMDSATRERGKHETLAALLGHTSKAQPVLIRVEDIHWADRTTIDFLRELGTVTESYPVILLLTTRPQEAAEERAWRDHAGDSPLLTLDLAPLRPAEAKALAGAFHLAAEDVEAQCLARSGGNPLFLEQLLRSAASQSGDDSLPASIRSLVLARIDRLTAPDRQALQLAALLGQRFSLEDLCALSGDPSYHCEPLLAERLVRRDGDAYLFAHALVQEAAYASLPPSVRRDLHARQAERVRETDPVLCAEHLERAGDAGAADAYLTAAKRGNDAHRYEQALLLVEHALGLSPAASSAVSCSLRRLQGEVLRELGRAGDSLEAFNAALELADSNAERSQIWIGIAASRNLNDERDAALEALEKAEVAADESNQLRDLSRLHYLRGAIGFASGNIAQCSASHRRALEFARRAASPLLEARALSGVGDAEYASGHMRKAYDSFQRCLALCERHGLGQVEAANRFMLGTVRIYLNELDRALEDSLRSAEMAARVGHKRAEIVSRLTCAWIYIEREDLGEAEEQARAGLALAVEIGARRFEPFLNESVARIQFARGDRAGAQATLDDAMRVCRETGLAFIGPWLLATQALASDDAAQVSACLSEGEQLLEQGCVGHNYFRFYQSAMDIRLQQGDWAEARRHADALEAYTASDPAPWSQFYIARARALADFGAGSGGTGLPVRLEALRAQAIEAGLRTALPAIEQAL